MEALKTQIKTLPAITVDDERYLSYQAVTDAVAAFLFPSLPPDQIDADRYQPAFAGGVLTLVKRWYNKSRPNDGGCVYGSTNSVQSPPY